MAGGLLIVKSLLKIKYMHPAFASTISCDAKNKMKNPIRCVEMRIATQVLPDHQKNHNTYEKDSHSSSRPMIHSFSFLSHTNVQQT